MRPFSYQRAGDAVGAAHAGFATGAGEIDAPVQFLAGGTTLIDLMKLDVLTPQQVVDINPLEADHSAIEATPEALHLGALARMAIVAAHPAIQRDYPVIAQSLSFAASPQLRNMASLGGNVLQRTRCPYFRDPSWTACNKRKPGSGCSALTSVNTNHAVLGVSKACIAEYPGDFATALAALGADVDVLGPGGPRVIALDQLHRAPGISPHIETTLKPGELITGFHVKAEPWFRRSLYLKIRDRASYEFALASAAIALDLDGEMVRDVRIGLGGIAYRPWRSHDAERVLIGKPLTEAQAEAAAHAALTGAVTHGGNDDKPELARRTLVRALLQARDLEV